MPQAGQEGGLAPADAPAAEEARVVAEEMGCAFICEYDVGVAWAYAAKIAWWKAINRK